MTCFATPTSRRGRAALLAVLLLLGAVSGCAEAPLPQNQPKVDDCLRDLQLEGLQPQIQRCSAVVAAFPAHPGPLNDRYLLRSLAGDDQGACRDIERAMALAARLPNLAANQDLRDEIRLRRAICRTPRQPVTPPASAPAAPAP